MSTNDNKTEKESKNINVKRSDGLSHDLLSVFSGIDLNSLSNYNIATESKVKTKDHSSDDHSSSIQLHRSDGISHDIIKVFKANSASNCVGESNSKKPSSSKIDVSTATSGSLISSNYFPSTVRIVHMSVSY